MPRELVVFDTETKRRFINLYDTEQELVFGFAAYRRVNRHGNWSAPRWFRFETGLQFYQWLESIAQPKKRLYVFCHNANFDWQSTLMVRHMPGLGWNCEKAIIEDPPNYFLWRKDNKSIAMLDTTNYWQEPLAKIGDSVGLAKLDFPPDWEDVELADTYCKRDIEILLLALDRRFKWLRDNDFGSFAISQASQAWTAYRHRFMDEDIFIDDNEDALELARASYMGGRTEAWRIGVELHDVHVLDVNQMYPAVMRDNWYPAKLISIYKRVTLEEITRWCNEYCVVATVLIETDLPIYPQRVSFGIVFPTGRFWTTLTTGELQCALRAGHVTECSVAAVYERAKLFKRWVDELHALRVKYQEAGELLYSDYTKKASNSLYGKFGQRGGHEEIIGYCDDMSLHVETEIDLDTGKRYRIRHIAGVIMCRALDAETRDSHPAIASHVTGYARQVLWQYAVAAGIERVYYMDTDSIHTDREGYARLAAHIDPRRLGALKLERVVERALYRGAKDYTLDDATKTKGIRKKAVEISQDTYFQEQWVSIRGSCQLNHTGGPLVLMVVKHLQRQYRKGDVAADGVVSPLRRTAD
jgi:hypothetical protein